MRKGLNVFIVDDEYAIINWLKEHIEWEAYGCNVVGWSTDAGEALRYIEEQPIDLLLTDINMPGLSGLDLIKCVKMKKPEIFILVISAYDKFEYVKEALHYGIIDYCLKPIDTHELHSCLKSIKKAFDERVESYRDLDYKLFRNSLLQRLLNGEDGSSRLEEQCQLAGIDFEAPGYQVAIMNIEAFDRDKRFSLLRQFEVMEQEKIYSFLDLSMNLVFLAIGENKLGEEFEKRVKEILQKENILKKFFLCFGREVSCYSKISFTYNECKDFLNAEFLFGERICHVSDYSYEKYRYSFEKKEIYFVLNSIKDDNPKVLIEVVRGIVKKERTERNRKRELVCLAVFIVNNVHIFYPQRDVEVMQEILQSQGTSEEMLQKLEKLIRMIIGVSENVNGNLHPCIIKALQEINNHYADCGLSLQEVAKKCNVSSGYLGKLFKNQIGVLFNEYLLDVRLKIAEIILLDGKVKMKDAALQTGFSNQSYFNKKFRKKYGVSPIEYRRKFQEKD